MDAKTPANAKRLPCKPLKPSKGSGKDDDWPSEDVSKPIHFPYLCVVRVSRTSHGMYPTIRLLQHACRITLFTRANCSLCTKAKQTLSDVWDVRPFEFKEIDVMKPEEKNWRDLYEYDTPVVSLWFFYVSRTSILTAT